LIEQIAVGAMDFDAIEACGHGVLGAFAERLDDAWDLIGFERARNRIGTLGAQKAHMAFRSDRARRDGKRAVVIARIGNAPDMPELEEYSPTRLMHPVGDQTPARDLLLRPDAGRMRIADAERRHRSRFGDDESRRSALDVIVAHQGVGDAPSTVRSIARERGHEDAVGKPKIADGDWVKERRHETDAS
jgi:hypothetical protein